MDRVTGIGRLAGDVLASVRKQSALVLMYHSISGDSEDLYAVSPDMFRTHLAAIARSGLPVIPASRLIRMVRGDEPLVRSVCLTFDDGLEDFATTARPILSEFGFPSALFVTTTLPGTTAHWKRWSGPRRFLDWAELQDLVRKGVEIGSHSANHVRLIHLTEPELAQELCTSRQALAMNLDAYLNAISYPYGGYTPSLERAVQGASYEAGFVGGHLWGNRQGADLFQLRRRVMRNRTTGEEIASILAGTDDWKTAAREFWPRGQCRDCIEPDLPAPTRSRS